MKIQIISLFPDMFEGLIGTSMIKKAQDQQLVEFKLINLRDFGIGKRRTVDGLLYGGGDGMLLRPEPMYAAVEFAKNADKDAQVILPTPRGEKYKQSTAKSLAAEGRGLIIICPRYEGYDERITELADRQVCIGNYVLTGGELPAMIVIDSVVRLIPGVLGGENSLLMESFNDDKLIEYPQYTRPENFNGLSVPEVLLSGNHAEIESWRKKHTKLQ
ncbi:MAG TPA: tRNA (guanosine(37)-N1)-methyltransferase TrmD [Candidatus Saccharimonadales bacterium]|nr:tRNA (guanosine(37)-N1)-methyltransferase TrmD [Candidatus Saccharimonadales bacterium]